MEHPWDIQILVLGHWDAEWIVPTTIPKSHKYMSNLVRKSPVCHKLFVFFDHLKILML